MSDNDKMLFNLQRFQILDRYAGGSAGKKFSSAYAYAWSVGVYPTSNHGGGWHEPYKATFRVPESAVLALAEFLDKKWDAKDGLTFYQLEAAFDPRRSYDGDFAWDRMDLIHTCRYFYLADWFDEAFWDSLVGGHDCPSESHSVRRAFGPEDVYFE